MARTSGAMIMAVQGGKSIVLIGLMGAGKTSVGRRLQKRLGLPFNDSDDAVAAAAGCSIDDIFEIYGEEAFRSLERQVISRLLLGGQQILATGGGAFMDPETRALIKDKGISIWLRAELDILLKRTEGRSGRPLLAGGQPAATLQKLIGLRYPVYGQADIIIDVRHETPAQTTKRVAAALAACQNEYFESSP